jgi:hypothetical protein
MKRILKWILIVGAVLLIIAAGSLLAFDFIWDNFKAG